MCVLTVITAPRRERAPIQADTKPDDKAKKVAKKGPFKK